MPPDLLERATDQNENEIPLKEIKTNVTGGGVTEKWYSVQVDRETLEKMRKTKNPLKLYSKTVKIKLGSLPQAVDGFLMRVDEVFPPRTNANEMTAQQHKDTSTFVSRDDSQKTTTVKSSQLYTEDTGFLREYHQFIATKKDDGTVSYEIICYSNRTPPDLFEKAVDKNGNEIPLKEIKTSVTKDGITEKWHSVQVSRDFLENMRRAKTPMTLYSKTISFKLTTEPQVVDGFLMRVDEALKE